MQNLPNLRDKDNRADVADHIFTVFFLNFTFAFRLPLHLLRQIFELAHLNLQNFLASLGSLFIFCHMIHIWWILRKILLALDLIRRYFIMNSCWCFWSNSVIAYECVCVCVHLCCRVILLQLVFCLVSGVWIVTLILSCRPTTSCLLCWS